MDNLKITLKNCYGISSLNHEFEFNSGSVSKPKARAYAVYAPNGLMKSSFAKTFDTLSKDEKTQEKNDITVHRPV